MKISMSLFEYPIKQAGRALDTNKVLQIMFIISMISDTSGIEKLSSEQPTL